MAWPDYAGTNGFEAFGTQLAAAPVSLPLPVADRAAYYDPTPLNGAGLVLDQVVLTFGASTVVARSRRSALEVEFLQPEVYGVHLLDSLVFDPSEPCALVLDVYDDDRATIRWSVGTSPAHPHPYLDDPGQYGEQEIDVATGSASIGTVTVTIIDPRTVTGDQDSGWFTAILAASGVPDIVGRRCRLRRFISEALGYMTLADGPASSPRLAEDYASYSFDIRDTRETERKVRIFEGGGGVAPTSAGAAFDPTGVKTILPDAVWGGYGYDLGTDTYLIDPAEPLLGRAKLGTAPYAIYENMRYVSLTSLPGNASALRVIGLAAWRAAEGTPAFTGQETVGFDTIERQYRVTFKYLTLLWRAQGSSDPWTEISGTLVIDRVQVEDTGAGTIEALQTNPIISSPYPSPSNETHREATAFVFGDSRGDTYLPAPDQDIEFILVYRGPPSKDLPVYIEGITAGEFARNVYAGVYSLRDPDGSLVATGIRYDEAALLQMTDVLRLRLFEVVTDARDWLEKHIYAPTGWVPALDRFGRISPVSQEAPTSALGLSSVNDAITEPAPNWNGGERLVNVLRFTYPRDYEPNNAANAETGDGLAQREIVIEWEDPVSVDRNGRQVLEIDGTAFAAIGNGDADPIGGDQTLETAFQLSAERQLHVQNRYTLGAPTITVAVMREAIPLLRAGDWVVLDLTWLPDYVTARRGLVALGQVVALGDLDCAWRQLTLEVVVPLVEPGS